MTLALAALSDASAMAESIRFASTEIQSARSAADDEIGQLVSQLKSLLDEFKLANDAVSKAPNWDWMSMTHWTGGQQS